MPSSVTSPVPAPTAAARRPELSVIVPSVNGAGILLECLEALRVAAARGTAIEVLVVERCGDAVRRQLAEHAPEAVVLPVAPRTTIPQMRALGFRRAQADAVAVIEDHVLVPPEWARQLLDALAEGADVVGGSVQNAATTTTSDWAAFLCEYSQMLAPAAGADVESLAGNNVVYRRALVERHAGLLDEGRWEDHFHAALRRAGVTLTCRPQISVGHKMHLRPSEYLAQRFLFARAWAGMKGEGMSLVRRALFAVGSCALPPLLYARIVTRVLAARRCRAELARSLPLLALFVCAWAAGEAVGFAAGPGDALERVR